MDTPYYTAYDQRYRQVHGKHLQWFSDTPSPIVLQTMEEFAVPAHGRILEIGCGEGRDAFALLQNGFDLLATDVSREAIAWCRSRMPEKAPAFRVLDCLEESLPERFDFIYAVAVVHMLVEDEHRQGFYRFFREHLSEQGIGLICTMGDGELERSTDTRTAFHLQNRVHGQSGEAMLLAATSCRMVSFPAFRAELEKSGLRILKTGLTAVEPDFPTMMYAVITGC